MYYTRDRDNSKVVGELEKLGFAFTLQPSRRSSRASNCVRCGAKVTPDEVQVVALALLRAGVGLQAIKPFENSPDKDWIIEIGNRNMDLRRRARRRRRAAPVARIARNLPAQACRQSVLRV